MSRKRDDDGDFRTQASRQECLASAFRFGNVMTVELLVGQCEQDCFVQVKIAWNVGVSRTDDK